jgi:isoaspartyl peptidase/L-asparaginase-like protein (Ntn-hydrolase superfamily)
MRYGVAFEIAARLRLAGYNQPQQAAKAVIDATYPQCGGSGGLVAVDRSGGLTLPFNTGRYVPRICPG